MERPERSTFPRTGPSISSPTRSRYGAIKPVPHSMIASGEDMVRRARGRRIGWPPMSGSCLLHNTRLGRRIPIRPSRTHSATATSTVSAPRRPMRAPMRLALRSTSPSPIRSSGVSLETPGFLPYAHGYHHEFALNRPNRWLDAQLGLCFCEHCVAGAKRAGIQRRVAAADGSRPTSRPILRATSTFPPIWPRLSGSPIRGRTATWPRSSTGAAPS